MSVEFRSTIAERLPGLARCRRFVGLAWSVSRPLMSAVVVATVVGALTPLVVVVAIARIVGQVLVASGTGVGSGPGHTALVWAVVVGVLFAVQRAAGAVQSAAAEALRDRVDMALQRSLMAAANGPVGIAHLEDPENADLIAVGRDSFRAWLRPGRLASLLGTLASAWIVVAGSVVIIARFHVVVAVAFAAGAMWTVREVSAASRRSMEHHHGATEAARKVQYYYDLAVTPAAAKEVRIFGLADVLTTWFLRGVAALGRPDIRTQQPPTACVGHGAGRGRVRDDGVGRL